MCNLGWIGDNCDQGICPQNCSSHGGCVTSSDPPKCDCNFPYLGDDCSQVETAAVPSSKTKSLSSKLPDYRIITGAVLGVAVIGIIVVALIIAKKRRERRIRLTTLSTPHTEGRTSITLSNYTESSTNN